MDPKKKKPLEGEELNQPGAEHEEEGGEHEGENEKMFPESVVKSLRSENAKQRSSMKTLKDQLAALEARIAGVNLEEYEELKAAKEGMEREKAEKQGDVERVKETLKKEHDKEAKRLSDALTASEKRVTDLQGELERTILQNAISTQAAAAKARNPRVVELLLAQEAKIVTQENGQKVVRLYDEAGEERLSGKTGAAMTISERLEEMKQTDELAHLFEGARVGAGSGSGYGGKGQKNPWKGDSLNITEQGRLWRDQRDVAKRLMKEAGVVPYDERS